MKGVREHRSVSGAGACLFPPQGPLDHSEVLLIPLSPVLMTEASPTSTRMRPREEAIEHPVRVLPALLDRLLKGNAHQRIDRRVDEPLGERVIRIEFGFEKQLGRRLDEVARA
ncbi:hypothetical protein [Bradyrhizobium sp. ARR65]|uniref:hypothetical protein n=1 Tax=Bradyrhizobium sp. ARR65 TaxID=1040989 RepID=UPI0012F9977C|nr:hypothetical protein [Bradyrhizobium sp. ARR65]